MRANATGAGGAAGRALWPLLAAIIGLSLPGLMIAKIGGFSGAGWIIVFGVTLLLPLLAGVTLPNPRSLWNVPVALQLAEVVTAVWLYFQFQDVFSQNPLAGQVVLGVVAFRIITILWLYAANSAIAAWLICIYQGMEILYTVVAPVLVYYQLGRVYPIVFVLMLAEALLRGSTIYLMLRALAKVREFQRMTAAAPLTV
jgi:hypothetical protein